MKKHRPNSEERLYRKSWHSLWYAGESPVRFLIAVFVIGFTLWMTYAGVTMPAEWEAVFLLVLGFYFKDRPQEDKKIRALLADKTPKPLSGGDPQSQLDPKTQEMLELVPLRGEMVYQFILASVLIAGAAFCFLRPEPKTGIPAAWIGGVLLAVGFYFKKGTVTALEGERESFRRLLVIVLLAATIPIVKVLWCKKVGPFPIPLQWIGVILVVVGFYFKENESQEKKPGAP
jgi:hypothetical protein